MSAHNLGDLVRLVGVFKATATGEVQDPTVVNVSIRRPSGQVNTYTYLTDAAVIRDSAGRYHYDLTAEVPGAFFYRWWSTGTGQAGIERRVDITAAKAVAHS